MKNPNTPEAAHATSLGRGLSMQNVGNHQRNFISRTSPYASNRLACIAVSFTIISTRENMSRKRRRMMCEGGREDFGEAVVCEGARVSGCGMQLVAFSSQHAVHL